MKDTMILQLYDLKHTLAGLFMHQCEYPWEVLPYIGDIILMEAPHLGPDYKRIGPEVWAHKSAYIAPTACIEGPCIIGPNSQVRHCAYIRQVALIGADCVVGNSTELKNCILFDGVQVPHFNYVGDSILGYKAHMGAGAVTSNVRGDKQNVTAAGIDTQRKKVGAFLGDRAEVGCNAVLNPGTVVGRDAQIYPTACVRGVVPAESIYKADGTVVKRIKN